HGRDCVGEALSPLGGEADDDTTLVVWIGAALDEAARLDLQQQLAHRLARRAHAPGQRREARAFGVEITEQAWIARLHLALAALDHAADGLVVHGVKEPEQQPQQHLLPFGAQFLRWIGHLSTSLTIYATWLTIYHEAEVHHESRCPRDDHR